MKKSPCPSDNSCAFRRLKQILRPQRRKALLALALYALLKPVNKTLALLGSFWRIANAGLLGVGVASSLVALDLFSNPNYMSLLGSSQLHPIALIFFNLHDRLSLMGLMFFCLGAGVHS
jgi:hypothetical protein